MQKFDEFPSVTKILRKNQNVTDGRTDGRKTDGRKVGRTDGQR